MVVAEDIRNTILRMAERQGPNKTFCASDVAMAMDKNNWHELIDQVRFVADVMIREGKITAIPSAEQADTFRGN